MGEKDQNDLLLKINELRIILSDLLRHKDELKELLQLLQLLQESKAERYAWFVSHSKYGKNCTYAKKAKLIFERIERDKILNKISEIYKKYIQKT